MVCVIPQAGMNGGMRMKAFKCDRCGAFYINSAYIQVVDGDGFTGDVVIDLCPACMSQFLVWRYGNGE